MYTNGCLRQHTDWTEQKKVFEILSDLALRGHSSHPLRGQCDEMHRHTAVTI